MRIDDSSSSGYFTRSFEYSDDMQKRRMKNKKNQVSKIKDASCAKGQPKFRLKDLLTEITPENRQGEVDWPPPVGKEEW